MCLYYYADTLIYIAKRLVVVVVSSVPVIKTLFRLAVAYSEDLLMLERLLGLNAVLMCTT